uniref:Bloodthirsty-related gene family, member 1 n=1 Tax=Oryzias latipes TaxID=8090 RepID=A0A3P9JGR8_ORYLA
MSIHGSFLSDDQFLCSICLDVFTNPSSIPCGHTFCMSCITRYWDQCECPLCKKSFPKRPILHVNRTLREITEQFKSMRGSEQEIQEMIRERTRKIEEIKMSMTERETASSVCMFTMLTSAIERSQAELIEVMEISRRAAEQQADSMIKQLEREIEELQIRDRALGELAQSDDHLHCTLSSPPPSKDWSGVSLNCDLGTSAVYRTLATMVKKFQEELQKVTDSDDDPQTLIKKCCSSHAVDVTLDSHTAHPRLVLSEDLKIVWCGDRHQHAADNPERFDRVVCVLGQQSISSGKHYWEVEVGGKTDWDLGVARQSISRKGKINYTPQNGFWFLSLRDKSKYAFRTEPSIDVNLNLRPHKIGIFVDYEKGQVSFYNVDAKVHIYTFNDNFTENIYPFFSPCTNKGGKNDLPLIITPIVLTK